MSYIKSNIVFPSEPFVFTEEDVKSMKPNEFDELGLSDQIAIYNQYPTEYARLTGRIKDTAPTQTEDTRSDAQRFADEFEKRVDQALQRAFHPNGA